MTEEEFREVVSTAVAFWNREWPVETLEVWWGQMRTWKARYMMTIIPQLAREGDGWLPSFAVIAEAYRIERTKAERHLTVARDPDRPKSAEDRDLEQRWTRVIHAQLRSFGEIAEASDVNRAVRMHYRRDGRAVVVLSGEKMLRAAEEALANNAFGEDTTP